MFGVYKWKLSLLSLGVVYFALVVFLYSLPRHHLYAPLVGYSFSDLLIALPFLVVGVLAFFKLRDNSVISLFGFLYLFLVYIPYFLFYSVKQNATLSFTDAILVTSPILIVFCQSKVNRDLLSSRGFYKDSFFDYLLVIIGIVSAVFTLIYAPKSSSFDLIEFERRMEAREVYTGALAYLNEMVMNAIIPFIAFKSIYNRKYWLAIMPLALVLVFYYCYGVKSPFVVMFLSFIGGIIASRKDHKKIVLILAFCSIALGLLAYFEFYKYEYSNIIAYVFRRLHYVMAFNVEAYLECFANPNFSWLGLWGMKIQMPASIYIGEVFLQSQNLNANTNTFMYYLIQYGLPGYVFSLLSVWAILIFFDSWNEQTPTKSFIAGIFCLMIMEKSFTTSLISSGMLVLILLHYFAEPKVKHPKIQSN